MKAFLLSFDRDEGLFSTFNYQTFHNQLTTAKGVHTWWHHLQSTYILIVDDSVNAPGVAKLVRAIAPNKLFLCIEVNPRDHDGWLPKEAWEWLNKQQAWVRHM